MKRSGSAIGITGIGAVTPAGWGMPAMMSCLRKGEALNTISLEGQGQRKAFRHRPVPKTNELTGLFRSPRLRRASPVSRYLSAAAFEALGQRDMNELCHSGFRLGIVVSCYTGCVNYSQRFYREVLDNPQTASPIIFPETVFNAPSSHLAALLSSAEINYTLVGDESQFLSAVELGVNWILDDGLDAVLIAAAEENNWLTAEGLSMFANAPVLGEGAAAVLLEPCESPHVEVELITEKLNYGHGQSRNDTLNAMRQKLPDTNSSDLLLEGINEGSLWDDFDGTKINVRETMGEGLGASVAWSCAAAAGFLESGEFNSALVSGSGMDQSCAAMILSSP